MNAPASGGTLLSQAGVYSFALFLVRAGNFLLVPLYTSLLSTEEYGLVGVLQQIVALLATTALCGQQTAALQLGVRASPAPDERRRLHSTQWTWVLSTGLALSCGAAALWPWTGVYLGTEMGPPVLAALLGVAGQATFLLHLAWRQQAGRAREHTWLSLSRWAFMVALSLLFVLGFRWGPAGILLAQGLSYWFGIVLGHRGVAARPGEEAPPVEAPRWGLDREQLQAALRLGLPVLPHALAAVAFVTTDRTLLATHHGTALAGLYTLAVSLASAVLLLGQGLHAAWAPQFLRLDLARESGGWHAARVQSYFMLCAVAIAALWIGLLAPEVIDAMAPPAYAAAAALVPLLAVVNFVRAYYQVVVGIVLADVGATRWLAVTTVPAALLNLALNALWIPEHGVHGAIGAMALTYAASSFAAGVLARVARPVPLKVGRALLLLPLLAGALVAGDGQPLAVRLAIGLGFMLVLIVTDLADVRAELVPAVRGALGRRGLWPRRPVP